MECRLDYGQVQSHFLSLPGGVGGIEPALVGGSFTTSATWEAHKYTEFPEHFYATSYKSIIREGDITDGEGNGNPLQYSCLENPVERGAWRATVHGVTKSQT